MTYEGRLRASEWEVRACSLAEAQALVRQHHYAGGGSNTRTYSHGLWRKDDETLCGVAWWIPPTKSAALATYPKRWQGADELTGTTFDFQDYLDPPLTEAQYAFLLEHSMTEASLTKQFCDAYRRRRPEALVEKINDRVARSRPDVNVTDYGQTWAIEFKRWDGELSPGQAHDLHKRFTASRGRVLVGWFAKDKSVRFVLPSGALLHTAPSIPDAAAWLEATIAARA